MSRCDDQAFTLKCRERFADRGGADVEPGGDVVLPQLAAGGDATAEDVFAKLGDHRVADRLSCSANRHWLDHAGGSSRDRLTISMRLFSGSATKAIVMPG